MDGIAFDYYIQQGFAICVAVYLLYERTALNSKTVKSLEKITVILEYLKEDLKEIKQK